MFSTSSLWKLNLRALRTTAVASLPCSTASSPYADAQLFSALTVYADFSFRLRFTACLRACASSAGFRLFERCSFRTLPTLFIFSVINRYDLAHFSIAMPCLMCCSQVLELAIRFRTLVLCPFIQFIFNLSRSLFPAFFFQFT